MRTVNSAHFQATRLLGLQTRNSAAYKGVMALVFRENALDFIDGEQMTNAKACSTPPDIHHIFPQAYCQKAGLPRERWNGIVNKTPLIASTSRIIGGYGQALRRAAGVSAPTSTVRMIPTRVIGANPT